MTAIIRLTGLPSILSKGLLFCGMPGLLAAGFTAAAGPVVVQARTTTGNPTVKVEGRLANITASPLALTPAFDPSITDYVLRCVAGTNSIQFTLSATRNTEIGLSGKNGSTIELQQTLVENQALIVDSRGSDRDSHVTDNSAGTQYWIRCLPHDFPQLSVTKPGNAPAGWYLTGNLSSAAGSGTYAMVLDGNGTPVWYRSTDGLGASNVTRLSNHTLAYAAVGRVPFGVDPNAAYDDYNFVTRQTTLIEAPVRPTDFHELQSLPNGHLLLLSTPLTSNIDLTSVGGPVSATIVDCVIQDVAPDGHLAWQWRASQHIDVAESIAHIVFPVSGQLAYDIFHCNSVDAGPSAKQFLLSGRHLDALFLIDRRSGKIIWKLGGKPFNRDHAEILSVVGDPQGQFHAQHDARFEPNGSVSLFDNQSWDPTMPARAVIYHVDPTAGVATLVWSFVAPDGHNSPFTGSFRPLNHGTDNVICWGGKAGELFTEVGAHGNVLLHVGFPSGEFAYRVLKVSPNDLSHALLRETAGAT